MRRENIMADLLRADCVSFTETNEFGVPCSVESYDLAQAAADEIRHLKHTIATQARTIAALRERLGEDHA